MRVDGIPGKAVAFVVGFGLTYYFIRHKMRTGANA